MFSVHLPCLPYVSGEMFWTISPLSCIHAWTTAHDGFLLCEAWQRICSTWSATFCHSRRSDITALRFPYCCVARKVSVGYCRPVAVVRKVMAQDNVRRRWRTACARCARSGLCGGPVRAVDGRQPSCHIARHSTEPGLRAATIRRVRDVPGTPGESWAPACGALVQVHLWRREVQLRFLDSLFLEAAMTTKTVRARYGYQHSLYKHPK